MFKKKIVMLIAAALMTLSASSAFAAFANFDLIRVVSDKTSGSTLEIATDLGNINTLAALGANSIVGGGINAFTNFTPGISNSNLSVAYFAVNRTSTYNGTLYIAANTTEAPVTGGVSQIQNKLATNGGAANSPVLAYYNTLAATGTTVVANNTSNASLAGKFGTTNLGTFGGFADAAWAGNTNLSLANLANAAVASTVWQFGNGTNLGAAMTGVKVLDLTTNADGSTTINATPVANTPIPAAAWLLGSGLMGLFGLRRKINA